MTKVKKGFMVFIAVVLSICSFSMTAYADDNTGIMPLYDYTSVASSGLAINNSKATASVYCSGYSGTTKKITAKTCIQRKLGLIWIKMDIGTSDDYWHDTANNYYLITSHSKTLTSHGTYRAKTEYTVTASNGDTEKITVTSQEVDFQPH